MTAWSEKEMCGRCGQMTVIVEAGRTPECPKVWNSCDCPLPADPDAQMRKAAIELAHADHLMGDGLITTQVQFLKTAKGKKALSRIMADFPFPDAPPMKRTFASMGVSQ